MKLDRVKSPLSQWRDASITSKMGRGGGDRKVEEPSSCVNVIPKYFGSHSSLPLTRRMLNRDIEAPTKRIIFLFNFGLAGKIMELEAENVRGRLSF